MRILVLAGALTAVAALASCGVELDAKERHDVRDFPFDSRTQALTIKSGVRVNVVPGTGSSLRVERWVRGKAAGEGMATWSLRGGTLTLAADCNMVFGDCGARYVVRVPGTPKLNVDVSDDDVRVTGLTGELNITTHSGNIHVESATGTVRMNSADGDLTMVKARSGVVRARTGSGDIDLSFAAPPAEVRALSTHGRVVTTVPEVDGSYRVKATSRHGTPRSDVRDAPRSERSLVLRSVSEDVRVRKGPPAAA
ncbi:DUF4097 family beta strand repeat-containing protein [Spongiactinospora sp. 9N601]|uniref:DUF4097 family beta strand repeat-containing protein n=1 Tax=Spongiactinospora sp. 9N601 TaxID=3375149 RepID=UPI00379A9976